MSTGTVTEWHDGFGQGRIRDDGLGNNATVVVYEQDVEPQPHALAVGERVEYELRYDPVTNRYRAYHVKELPV